MSHVLSAVAWPYANGPRHLGHVAGFGVPSDVFSRYMRMADHEVLMVSGSDEHGTPILVQAEKAVDALQLQGEEATGATIVKSALSAPLKQIAFNAGMEPGVVAEKVRGLQPGHGLNAATGEYEDLLAAGINDPVKVTRSALQNAASIAALFLTTEAVVADKPEPAAPAMPGADGGMGDMGF